MEWTSRTELLFGKEAVEKLKEKNVLVVGLGGVGGHCAEMLCRAGIGKLTIVDGDVVQPSNINRQLVAMPENINLRKCNVLAERLKGINPQLELTVLFEYIENQITEQLLDSQSFDYVVDAIDTLTPKSFLILHTLNRNIPIASSMGAGGKIDPTKVTITDISKTSTCALARSVRKRLGSLGIKKGVKVVFSTEPVNKDAVILDEESENKRSTVGTVSYMPAVFGCMLASIVIRDLVNG